MDLIFESIDFSGLRSDAFSFVMATIVISLTVYAGWLIVGLIFPPATREGREDD